MAKPGMLTTSSILAAWEFLQEGEVLLPTERDSGMLDSQSHLLAQTSICQMGGAGIGPRPQAGQAGAD